MVFLWGLPEVYLLRAGCKVRTNDLAGAGEDVETLRVKRMPASEGKLSRLKDDRKRFESAVGQVYKIAKFLGFL